MAEPAPKGPEKALMLDSALAYARGEIFGFPVPIIPLWPREGDKCGCGDMDCKSAGKHPLGDLVPNGIKNATTNEEAIRIWFEAFPNAGIGMPTGEASGISVIDLDNDIEAGKHGLEYVNRQEEKLGELPEGRMVRTPRGGLHRYFRHVDGIRNSQHNDILVDMRGEGGHITLPPSHSLYEWVEEGDLPELPKAWVKEINKLQKNKSSTSGYRDPALKWLSKTVKNIDKAKIEEKLDELAQLDAVVYHSISGKAAGDLGWTRSQLDKMVAERREFKSEKARVAEPVEPWPEPVDGAKLLDELRAVIKRYVILPHDKQATAIALWIIFTYAHDAADFSPMLVIWSPESECGKTTLTKLIKRLVQKPYPSASTTPAVIYRVIEKSHPTLILEEADAYITRNENLRGILDSGHEPDFAFTTRCVGDNHETQEFSTWCAKVISLKQKRMDRTLESRSIRIQLRRKLPSENIKRLRGDTLKLERLRRQCARFAEDNLKTLRKPPKKLFPRKLANRARDNWEMLLKIAALCGPDWKKCAQEAALSLSGAVDETSRPIQLLADIKTLFDADPEDTNRASAAIVAALSDIEERPWAEFRNGKPITTTQLAQVLKPFEIKPKQVRVGPRPNDRHNGYRRADFEDAWRRYLPASPTGASDTSDKAKKSKKKQSVKKKRNGKRASDTKG